VIGAAARDVGARVLHPSTDYVFPGTGTTPWREDDATDPVNWYGATKLAGERALAASGAGHLVVRVQWLFEAHGRSFPRTMWERARAGQATRVVADQFGAPTSTRDLARALWHLMRADARGTVHVASEGHGSWHDVAARVFAAAGRRELLTPCTSADYPTPAVRPGWSVFDLTRMRGLGVAMPRWEDAVDGFVAGLG
jgi:dTDP-4-dehydrorhamnose reductase